MIKQRIIFFTILTFLTACNGNYSGNEKDFKNSLIFEAKSFIAVGDGGSIITSDDGIVWNNITSGTTEFLYGISYNSDNLRIVGGKKTLLISSSLKSWDRHAFLNDGEYSDIRAISHGNDEYALVWGIGQISAISGKSLWGNKCGNNEMHGLAYGNNVYVAVGDAGSIFSANDGSCENKVSNTTSPLRAITYGNNLFIAVGYGGTIITSTDGNSWASRNSNTSNDLLGIAYINNKYIAVGGAGTILSSSDGITWELLNSGVSEDLYGIAYGENNFVAVGMEGVIITSTDTNTWTKRLSGIHFSINDVMYKTD